jgi:hypothetical protein
VGHQDRRAAPAGIRNTAPGAQRTQRLVGVVHAQLENGHARARRDRWPVVIVDDRIEVEPFRVVADVFLFAREERPVGAHPDDVLERFDRQLPRPFDAPRPPLYAASASSSRPKSRSIMERYFTPAFDVRADLHQANVAGMTWK